MNSLKKVLAIDWELSTKLAGNNRQFAEEIIGLLVKNLPTEAQQIEQAYEKDNNLQLAKLVHKLHGALCYCGVPRLKAITAELEAALKLKKNEAIPALLTDFLNEAKQVVNEFSSVNPS